MALAGNVLSISFLMTLLKNKSKNLLEGFFLSVPSLFRLLCPSPAPSCTPRAVSSILLPPSPSALRHSPFSTLYFLPLLAAAFKTHHLFSNPDY